MRNEYTIREGKAEVSLCELERLYEEIDRLRVTNRTYMDSIFEECAAFELRDYSYQLGPGHIFTEHSYFPLNKDAFDIQENIKERISKNFDRRFKNMSIIDFVKWRKTK